MDRDLAGSSRRQIALGAVVAVTLVIALAIAMVASTETTDVATEGSSSGWSRAPAAPVQERVGPVMSGSPGAVLLWGGHTADVDGALLEDGAVFRLAEEQWTQLQRGPEGPLALADAVWTGTEWIVLGSRCEAVARIDCTVSSLGAMALDPDKGAWTDIPDPIEPPRPVSGVGWSGESAIFALSAVADGSQPRELIEYAPSTQTWSSLPSPPFEAGFESCIADGTLVAARVSFVVEGERRPTDLALDGGFRRPVSALADPAISLYDTEDRSWSDPVILNREIATLTSTPQLLCGERHVALVFSNNLLIFETDQSQWRDLTAPPDGQIEQYTDFSVPMGDDIVFWGRPATGWSFDMRDEHWRRMPAGPADGVAAPVGQTVLLYSGSASDRRASGGYLYRPGGDPSVENEFPDEREGGP